MKGFLSEGTRDILALSGLLIAVGGIIVKVLITVRHTQKEERLIGWINEDVIWILLHISGVLVGAYIGMFTFSGLLLPNQLIPASLMGEMTGPVIVIAIMLLVSISGIYVFTNETGKTFIRVFALVGLAVGCIIGILWIESLYIAFSISLGCFVGGAIGWLADMVYD